MKLQRLLYLITAVSIVTGCHRDIPEPETKVTVVPITYVQVANEVTVTQLKKSEKFRVHHHVAGGKLFIECMLPEYSFRQSGPKNKAKIMLYVDGKKKQEISTAAFIIKDLPSGNHRIRLEVVKPNNEKYHLRSEFYVTIP